MGGHPAVHAQHSLVNAPRTSVAEQDKQIAALQAEIARLKKNSSNSSKPPSSDIVKPPKEPPKGGGKRKIGGPRGHAKHQREPFAPDQIDQHLDYELPAAEVAARRLPSTGRGSMTIRPAARSW
ncbi:MAG: DUF6444 domain-containing protein [Phycisphaerae bacterium]